MSTNLPAWNAQTPKKASNSSDQVKVDLYAQPELMEDTQVNTLKDLISAEFPVTEEAAAATIVRTGCLLRKFSETSDGRTGVTIRAIPFMVEAEDLDPRIASYPQSIIDAWELLGGCGPDNQTHLKNNVISSILEGSGQACVTAIVNRFTGLRNNQPMYLFRTDQESFDTRDALPMGVRGCTVTGVHSALLAYASESGNNVPYDTFTKFNADLIYEVSNQMQVMGELPEISVSDNLYQTIRGFKERLSPLILGDDRMCILARFDSELSLLDTPLANDYCTLYRRLVDTKLAIGAIEHSVETGEIGEDYFVGVGDGDGDSEEGSNPRLKSVVIVQHILSKEFRAKAIRALSTPLCVALMNFLLRRLVIATDVIVHPFAGVVFEPKDTEIPVQTMAATVHGTTSLLNLGCNRFEIGADVYAIPSIPPPTASSPPGIFSGVLPYYYDRDNTSGDMHDDSPKGTRNPLVPAPENCFDVLVAGLDLLCDRENLSECVRKATYVGRVTSTRDEAGGFDKSIATNAFGVFVM